MKILFEAKMQLVKFFANFFTSTQRCFSSFHLFKVIFPLVARHPDEINFSLSTVISHSGSISLIDPVVD